MTGLTIARRCRLLYSRPMHGGVVGLGGQRCRVMVSVLCAMGVTALSAFSTPANTSAELSAAGARLLRAYVVVAGPSRDIPAPFLGLSVEVSELPVYARAGSSFDRVVSLLRTGTGDPILLRVGGRSADEAYWKTSTAGAPRWVSSLGDGWLRLLASLVRRDDFRVTLALNLAVHSPTMAASFARAVSEALPPGRLVELAVGNEPDLFRWQRSLNRERIPSTVASIPTNWAQRYSAASYRSDFRSYAKALTSAVPGIPLAGPETTQLTPGWLGAVDGLGSLGPATLTVHRYPSSACWSKASPAYPSIPLLLSERSSAGLATALRGSIAFAHGSRMSFRVTEVNSVSCGAGDGVADSFATALWAPDVLFELMRAGVDGVNWHIRPRMLNAPFEVRGGAIEPLPELYGLALFAQMIGSKARLMRVRIAAAKGLHLKVWALRSTAGTDILVINKGARVASVSLCCGSIGRRVRLERLVAPSLSARDGITLAGRTIGSDGRWHGRRVTTPVRLADGRYRVLVPRYSAVLVSGATSHIGHPTR